MIETLRNIAAGEEIMVRYQESGYYGSNCQCKTCTTVDPKDLSVLKERSGVEGEGLDSTRVGERSRN